MRKFIRGFFSLITVFSYIIFCLILFLLILMSKLIRSDFFEKIRKDYLVNHYPLIHLILIILLFVIVCFIYLKSYESKIRFKQLNIVRELLVTSSRIKDEKKINQKFLNSISKIILNYMKSILHRKFQNFIFTKRNILSKTRYGPKSLVVLVPDYRTKKFHFIYSHNDNQVFQKVMEKHTPSFYNEKEFMDLLSSWYKKDIKEREEYADAFLMKKKDFISMAGYILEHPKTFIENDALKSVAWDEEYLAYIKKENQKSHRIRSFIVSPLRIKNEIIGVLFITATIRYAFFPSDIDLIKMISPIIARHVYNIKSPNDTDSSGK